MIIVKELTKAYPDGESCRTVLTLPEWIADDGSQWALVGPSGSGKSTLLHCLSGLTRPTSGTLTIDDADIVAQSEAELDEWRGRKIGYVLQNFSLLPTLTAAENIAAGAFFAGRLDNDAVRKETAELLAQSGLAGRADQLPGTLSMGEQQRVAIIRALIKQPLYLFADEPTASLDTATGKIVMDLLQNYAAQHRATLIVATHDPDVAARFKQTLHLQGGVPC